MITAREASAAIYGAWKLAKYDGRGIDFFDGTVTAFWRSFYAALIVLPAYIILVLLRLADTPVTAGPFATMLIEVSAYVIGWTAFPLIMFYIARLIDRDALFCRYIVAANWASVLQITFLLAVTSVAASGVLPTALAAMITFVATIAILAYEWFIARVGLQISGPAACGIVILNLLISLIVSSYSDRLLQGHGLLG